MASSTAPINSSLPACLPAVRLRSLPPCLPYACAPYHLRSLPPVRLRLPSAAPFCGSRGAAVTTAGRIYFSTPSAQVRIPLTGPLLSPPTSAHTILLGGNLSGGGKIIPRRRKNYPAAE